MGKRLDYDKVYREFQERGYTILVDELPKWDEHIPYRCSAHPDKELKISYKKFKEGRGCKYCFADRKRLKQEDVVVLFESKGFILLDKYHVKTDKLRCICVHHPDKIQYRTKTSIEKFGCPYCYHDRLRLDPETIITAFNEVGYKVLEEVEGKKTTDPIKYECPKHGAQKISYHHLSHGARCRECRREEQAELLRKCVGANSRRWKGGVTKLQDYFRWPLEEWRNAVFARDGYRCVITGKKSKRLHAHHLIPFHKILEEAFEAVGVDRQSRSGEYAQEELEAIREYVVSKHTTDIGVTLDKKVHELFHSIYGYDADPVDFEDFKTKYEAIA